MSLANAFPIVGAVLVVAACGSAASVQPAGTDKTKPPPAIEAIDDPYPDAAWSIGPDDAAERSTYMCLGGPANTDGNEDCEPSPELKEKLRRQEQEFFEAVRPAKGSQARAVARLELPARGPTSRALLVVWRNQADELCFETAEEDADGGGGGGPDGPCVPETGCGKICLDFSGSGSGSETRYLLSGIVASEADALRMTLDDGRVTTYPLTGPLVPGSPQYRVFLLDLGKDLYERLELLRGEKPIAEEKLSRLVINSMRCSEKFPVEEMPTTRADAERSPLNECLQKAGAK